MTGQPPHLAAWQLKRRETLRCRAIEAIQRMDRDGQRITVAGVARHGSVDRTWLYTQSDLMTEITRLREETNGPLRPRPQQERASDASLATRLRASQDLVAELRAEIATLRAENDNLRTDSRRPDIGGP